jgi:hypothetical protein
MGQTLPSGCRLQYYKNFRWDYDFNKQLEVLVQNQQSNIEMQNRLLIKRNCARGCLCY